MDNQAAYYSFLKCIKICQYFAVIKKQTNKQPFIDWCRCQMLSYINMFNVFYHHLVLSAGLKNTHMTLCGAHVDFFRGQDSEM